MYTGEIHILMLYVLALASVFLPMLFLFMLASWIKAKNKTAPLKAQCCYQPLLGLPQIGFFLSILQSLCSGRFEGREERSLCILGGMMEKAVCRIYRKTQCYDMHLGNSFKEQFQLS